LINIVNNANVINMNPDTFLAVVPIVGALIVLSGFGLAFYWFCKFVKAFYRIVLKMGD
jgi:hypothetical protein